MLGSISPVGEASRQQRWWLTAAAYTLASLAGGAVTGLLLGGAGHAAVAAASMPVWLRLVLLGAVALAGAVADANASRWALPTWHRQVNERWLSTYRGWVYGVGFGFQLGTGVATIVTSAATYGALAAAFLAGSWGGGLAIGLVFGAVRSLPLLLTGALRDVERMYDVTARVATAQPLAHRLTVAGQATVGVVALAGGGALVAL